MSETKTTNQNQVNYLGKLKDDVNKQIMDLMNKMINEFTKDNNKKLSKLNKYIPKKESPVLQRIRIHEKILNRNPVDIFFYAK